MILFQLTCPKAIAVLIKIFRLNRKYTLSYRNARQNAGVLGGGGLGITNNTGTCTSFSIHLCDKPSNVFNNLKFVWYKSR